MAPSVRMTLLKSAFSDYVRRVRTEPIARKNENVAALPSIYCESVGRTPRGPAPPLPSIRVQDVSRGSLMKNSPQDAEASKQESHGETHTRAHYRPHSAYTSITAPYRI